MLNLSHFLFEAKDDQHSELIPALEMFNYNRFKLLFHNWKYTFLNTNFFDINTMQLPWDSVYHTFDNVEIGSQKDFPKVLTDPLIRNEAYYKWILHITQFNNTGPLVYDEKHNFINGGLRSTLNAFRSEYKNMFRYITRIDEIPTRKESLTIVNYNPLFRCYTFGVLKFFKKMNLILTTVMNTVADVLDKYPTKHQYILIPWDTQIFTRDQFIRSKIILNNTSVKFSENFHYIFMMYLLNFIDPDTKMSLLEAYPKKYWAETNFILRCGTKGTIFNLQELMDLNHKNRAYLKIVSHCNTLSILGGGGIITTDETDNGPTNSIPIITDTKPTIVIPDINAPTVDPNDPNNTVVTDRVDVNPKVLSTAIKVDTSPVSVITDTKAVIARNIVPMVKTTVPTLAPTPTTSKFPSITPDKPVVNNDLLPSLAANITLATPETNAQVIRARSKAFVDEVDTAAKAVIAKQDQLTPKQKQRLEQIAVKYKQLSLNDRPLTDILLNSNDVTIDDVPAQGIVDNLPDKSMAKSTVFNFDKAYVNKTMEKDMVSIAIEFNKNGMFLTDIKTTTILNELVHATEYTFNYEDVNGKKHTIKFTIPIIDHNGYCYINGVKKLLKKQMVNIPICKIGENKVSMVSNQNKVLVFRNTAKAHSYLAQMDKVFDLGKDKLTITFGTLELNIPLAYEYTTLATKYNTIILKKLKGNEYWDSDKIIVCLDYFNRFKVLTDELNRPKVDALEKRYGTLIGKQSNVAYYFIDVNNHVSLVNIKGEEVTPASIVSIIDIFKTYLPPEVTAKIGFITEWADLNLVSKPLPVGFALAYRFGLKETLEHLGVKYKLLAKRGKSIVEEGGIVATESFEVIPHMDKIVNIDTRRKWKIADVQHLELLDKYGISKDECIIGGGAAMLAHRYTGGPNNDLDIVVSEETYTRLKKDTKNFVIHKYRDGIGTDIKLVSKDEKLEIFTRFYALPEDYDFDMIKKENLDIIDGYMFTDLEFLFKMYTKMNRPKDQDKIRWLTEHKGSTVAAEALTTDRYTYTPGDIVIKFKDCNLVFNRYPFAKSLIVAGLDYFNTEGYDFDQFDTKDVYYSLMEDRGIRSNYLKAVNDFFDLFVDSITRDVLEQMNEPTNARDLLIRACVLLTTGDHKEASAMANHRLRSYEQFNAIVYNEMARGLASFRAGRGKGNVFSINPNAVYQRIIQNQSFIIVEDANPLQELKDKTAFTFSGIGGRTSESFVVDDRRYPVDGIGIISESTVDNQKVSMNSYLTTDPTIANTRGLVDIKSLNELEPTQLLSATALTMPCSTNDDR